MRRDGGSVFPAHANTGDPNGPLRGLSANDVARALISMMVRSENELQSETGYIDARPHHPRSTKSSCTARPDHTLGQSRPLAVSRSMSGPPAIADIAR